MTLARKPRKSRPSRTQTALERADRMRGIRATYDPLKPETFTIALDTREQLIAPISLDIPIVVKKLPMGDFSVVGYENRIAIDRKQIGDFISCVTWERERFTRLLIAMKELSFAAVVVESTIADVRSRKYRADVTPSFVLGAAAKVTTKYGIPVFFCGSIESSTAYAVHLLRSWWRERGVPA